MQKLKLFLASFFILLNSQFFAQTHFTTVWSGSPYQAMNIFLESTTYGGSQLSSGDEIAVFDGSNCVGVVSLSGPVTSYVEIKASADDPATVSTIDGFVVGHTITYKLWLAGTSQEIGNYSVTYNPVSPVPTFTSLGTAFVNLQFTSTTSPQLSVTPTDIDLGSSQSGTAFSKTFIVRNTGSGILTGNISKNAAWITSVSPSSFSLTSSQQTTITVQGSFPTTSPFTSDISVTSNGGSKSVTVHGTVESSPAISVTPTDIDLGSSQSGTAFSKTFTVKNTGGGTLTGNVSESVSWITSVSPFSFSLTTNQSQTITIQGSFPSTSPFSTDVSVTSNGGNQNVTVHGVVTSSPQLSVTPTDIDLGSQQSGTSFTKNFTVKNIGGGTLTGNISENAAWITSVNPSSLALTANQSIPITINGVFPATSPFSSDVSVTSNGGNQNVTVHGLVTPIGNRPPTWDTGGELTNQTIAVGETLNFTYKASDLDGDALTYAFVGNHPSDANLDVTTGVFSWTPQTASQFPILITVSATDGKSPAIQTQAQVTVQILPTLLSPTNLGTNATGINKVAITWVDNSNNEDGYKLERTDADGSVFNLLIDLPANTSSFIDNSVEEGKHYKYRVKAYNQSVESAYSNESTILTPISTIESPSDVVVEPDTAGNFKISWSDNSNNEDGFIIQRGVIDSGSTSSIIGSLSKIGSVMDLIPTFVPIDTVPSNSTKYTDTNTNEGTSYIYQVAAFNSNGVSVPKTDTAKTTVSALVAPSNLTTTIFGSYFTKLEVKLEWVNNSKIYSGVIIERDDNVPPNYAFFASIASGISSYTDSPLAMGHVYHYRLKAYNSKSSSAYVYISSGIITDVESFDNFLPKEYTLYQNYPNPFNPETAISYQLSMLSFVNLKVFDVLGREVATLVNEEKLAGIYKVNFTASSFASGIYYYRIIAGDFVQIKKMILLK